MAFVHAADRTAREMARAPLEFANRLSLENVHVSAPGETLPDDYSHHQDWLEMYGGWTTSGCWSSTPP